MEEAALGPLVPATLDRTYPRSAPRLHRRDAVAGLAVSDGHAVDLGCSDHLGVTARLAAESQAGSAP